MNKTLWRELKDHIEELKKQRPDDIPNSCYDDVLIKMMEIESRFEINEVDRIDMREIPRISGKDAERFMESVRKNNKSMEERKAHLKKSIENAAKIKVLSKQDLEDSMEFRRKNRQKD